MEMGSAWRRGRKAAALLLVVLAAATACDRGRRITVQEKQAEVAEAVAAIAAMPDFVWPEQPGQIAVLEIEGMGEIHIGLYRELAPKNVAHFIKLARDGVYDDTLFHRVIPDFMLQGGDPNSREGDRRINGMGGIALKEEDEYNNARHDRGVVSFANRGHSGTAGSQFFIVHQDSRHLDGKYTTIGRVVAGMEIVDAITELEIDKYGRWGPKDHPIEDVKVVRVRIQTVGSSGGSDVAMSEGLGAGAAAAPGEREPMALGVPPEEVTPDS